VREREREKICVRFGEGSEYLWMEGGKEREEGGHLKGRDGERSQYGGSGCLTRGLVFICIWHVFFSNHLPEHGLQVLTLKIYY
jgi:hypothetical protein